MVLHCSDGVRTFHLFNCDKTCNLSQVKSLLDAVEKNVDFKIEAVEQHFRKYEMNALVQRIPELKMDYGVLVIHANDCLLFDENGYGEISKSMVQNSGSGRILKFANAFETWFTSGRRGEGRGKFRPDVQTLTL